MAWDEDFERPMHATLRQKQQQMSNRSIATSELRSCCQYALPKVYFVSKTSHQGKYMFNETLFMSSSLTTMMLVELYNSLS